MDSKWYLGTGAQSDVVISTRIRFARNIKEFAFPAKLSVPERIRVNNILEKAILSCKEFDFRFIEMKTMSQLQAVSLAERHLVSPEFASSCDGRALIITEDESVSIMLCEEDHIRLQVMKAGLSLDEAFKVADGIDDAIGAKLNYAFDDRIGFLTQYPTNLGTGMRASVMLHLPALTAMGQIQRLISTVSKLGLSIGGSYGEFTHAKGDLYQLSNRITLGISEKVAIENLKSIALQIAAQERAAREELSKSKETEDKIHRAYGILKHARLLGIDEFMKCISLIRLGAVQNILKADDALISKLMVDMQPATISISVERPLDDKARDELRAQLVRESLS
ncbi:MAG: putative ATP:guanido phosphotransferase [Firmicutes bacterium ADurb.Bin300]|nr:MAG: putative ATP:guanido phosphotransferase [Firmicutes bacterium ADurb.Bin300]